MHFSTIFLLLCSWCMLLTKQSRMLAILPETTFQTGIRGLVSGWSNRIGGLSMYTVTYTTPMSTSALNASLSVVSIHYSQSDIKFGYKIWVLSINQTALLAYANVKNGNQPVTYLSICYLVSINTYLDIGYVDYTFAATDAVANQSLSGYTCYSDVQECRKTTLTQNYRNKNNNNKVLMYLSGFYVNNYVVPADDNSSFGVTLQLASTTISNFTYNVLVFGSGQLSGVSFFYVSFELNTINAINVSGTRYIMQGTASVGCSYTANGCITTNISSPNPSSNTTISTGQTNVQSYYSQNSIFIGINTLILKYTSNTILPTSYGYFDLGTSPNLNGDTSYTFSFSFSGNPTSQFNAGYSFFTLFYLYCQNTGTDIYVAYNSYACTSNCNGTIGQYPDSNNFCQLCSTLCLQCTGTPTFCLQCYTAQFRILIGNTCACNPIGYYDDGVSAICPLCNTTCKSCNGSTSANCLSCEPLYGRSLNNNSCSCMIGFYSNGSAICQTCPYSCSSATCTSSGCSTCNSTKFRIYSSNACYCMSGYYDNGVSQLCSTCSYVCKTCSALNTCTACDFTTSCRVPNATTCSCVAGTFDQAIPICSPCNSTCYTCNGPLSTNCLTCLASAHRSFSASFTSCPCIATYYDSNVTCVSCHYSCYTCFGVNATSCISCDSLSTFRTLNVSSCICPAIGYVDMGVSVCQACSVNCVSCDISTLSCTSCNPAYFRALAGSTCPCNGGYVDVYLNGTCSICSYSCLTCTGITSTSCISCNTTYRIYSSGQCLCPSSFYDDGTNVSCQPCNFKCMNCMTNSLSSSCTACNSLYQRTLQPSPIGSCVCASRYYDNGSLGCLACHQSCLTCSIISNNCTTCDPTIDHRLITVNNTCTCLSGYYQVGAQICPFCLYPCVACSGLSNNCTTCQSDRSLINNLCICLNGTFQNSSNLCQSCDYTCLTCLNTSKVCLACSSIVYRTLSAQQCLCNAGYYDNGASTICNSCPYACSTCTYNNISLLPVCTACVALSFRTLLVNGTCACDSGYYDDGSNPTCQICSGTCLNCTSYSVCSACSSSQLRTLSMSSCVCMNGYYSSNLTSTCQPCHYNCLTCFNGTASSCFTCALNRNYTTPYTCPCTLGFYEILNSCSPCSLNCLTCTSTPINCTSCQSSYSSLDPLSNTCICNNGYFMNGIACLPCNIICLTCSITASTCTSCNNALQMHLNGSACECNAGMYLNAATNACMSCSLSCLTCSAYGTTSCLSCSSTSLRIYQNSSNSCICPSAAYYDNPTKSACQPCDSSCFSCNGYSAYNCTACMIGNVLIGSSCKSPNISCSNYYFYGVCVNVCPISTYPTNNHTCVRCINNCLTCTTATSCLSCAIGTYYNAASMSCSKTCSNGTYLDYNNMTCLACPASCLTCILRSLTVTCTKCANNTYLITIPQLSSSSESIANCTSICPTLLQTHILLNNINCVPCIQGCATCSSLLPGSCLTCLNSYLMYKGYCLLKCPRGYFQNLSRSCQRCEDSCAECDQNICLMCDSSYYLWIGLPSKCIAKGYFMNGSQLIKCHPNCATCTNSSFSSCISCVKYRGDRSELAISGYCNCQVGSLDVGNGSCDVTSYKQVQSANLALISVTSSTNYLSLVVSCLSLNPLVSISTATYQQLYSNFYYLNASIVLQQDSVLQSYQSMNLNRYLQSSTSPKQKQPFNRLLLSIQGIQSLFMRGYQWHYVSQWAFYTVLLISIIWLLIAALQIKAKLNPKIQIANLHLLSEKKGLSSPAQEKAPSSAKTLQKLSLMNENGPILIHMLTITQFTIYSAASMKIVYILDEPINYLQMVFSCILIAYYIGYLLRLFIGCIQNKQQQESSNKLKILFLCFEEKKLKLKRCRIYNPIILLRNVLMSLLLVFVSEFPLYQIIASLVIFVIFCIYSFICCPYPFYIRVFIRMYQFVFLGQIISFFIMIFKQENQRIQPTIALIFLNFAQIIIFIGFGIVFFIKTFYSNKCCKEQNKISPIQNNANREDTLENFQNSDEKNNSKLNFLTIESNTYGKKLQQQKLQFQNNEVIIKNYESIDQNDIPIYIDRKHIKKDERNYHKNAKEDNNQVAQFKIQKREKEDTFCENDGKEKKKYRVKRKKKTQVEENN